MRVLRIGLGLIVWAAVLGAALFIANVPGDWGHSICGPWGCGPPQQALLACHLAWLVVLVPPAVLLVQSPRVSARIRRQIRMLLITMAALFLAAVAIGQFATWWQAASEWQRGLFWQRCGFVVATMWTSPRHKFCSSASMSLSAGEALCKTANRTS